MPKIQDIKPINLDNKNPSEFVQKIRNFIQYNNAFVLIVVFILGISGVALGNENIREGVLLGKTVREIGVDNAVLLATNIELWNFEPMILDIEEDNELYYVTYKFKTLGIKDNIWQEMWRENLLKFEKNSDRYTDVATYITKEIGEVIQMEFQLLKDSQKIAREEGKSQRVKVVAYNGLLGRVLNLEEKVIPQDNPIISEEQIQSAQQTFEEQQKHTRCLDCQSQATDLNKEPIDKELIRKIVEEILTQRQAQEPVSTKTPSQNEEPPTQQPPTEEPPSTEEQLTCQPTEEICDGQDNNCDGQIDENCH